MKLIRAAAPTPPGAAEGRPEAPGRRPARRLRWIVGLTAGSIALTAGAIPAVAAVTTSHVVYYACVTNTTGTIKVVSATARCATGQHKISWNNLGPAGPTGPRGATGPQGPPGAPGANGVVNGFVDDPGTKTSIATSDTIVATLQLPAGNYVLSTSVTLSKVATTSGVVVCDLISSSAIVDKGAVTLAPDATGAQYASMSLGGASRGGTTGLSCAAGNGVTGLSAINPVITAVPVNTLTRNQ